MRLKHCNTDGIRALTTRGVMLKNKPNLITFNQNILVSLLTFQPTLVYIYIYIYMYIYITISLFVYLYACLLYYYQYASGPNLKLGMCTPLTSWSILLVFRERRKEFFLELIRKLLFMQKANKINTHQHGHLN